MIDFHSHVLPCVDDGSKSTDESIAMLRSLYCQGVKTVVATPHFYANNESVSDFLERRRVAYERLMAVAPDDIPQILLGAEVKFYSGIGNLTMLKSLCVQGTDLLLLEMPFKKWTEYTVKEVIDVSCLCNVTVVLAHIDRYLSYQQSGVWQSLLENDILMQMNAEAFVGCFSRMKALRLLRSGVVQYIGSDCHNLKDRSPNVGTAVKIIEKKLGKEFLSHFFRRCKKLLV